MGRDRTQGQAGFQIVAESDTGRTRDINEDCVAFHRPTEGEQLKTKGVLCVVADGMGGHAAGEVASQTAADSLLQAYFADPTPNVEVSLTAAVRAANAAVYEQAEQQRGRSRMGTTVVAAVLKGNTLYVANVGDSRAYLIHDERIEQITEDHSWVQEQIRAGVLNKEQVRTHPQRNVVIRALGLEPEVEVDLYRRTLEPGNVLILCSDGLWEPVKDAVIKQTVVAYPADEAAKRLIDLANRQGGPDNISVAILRIPAAPSLLRRPAVFARLPNFQQWPALAVVVLAVVVLAILGLAVVILRDDEDRQPATEGTATQPAVLPASVTPEIAGTPTNTPQPATATLRVSPTSTGAVSAPPAAQTSAATPETPEETPDSDESTPDERSTATGVTPERPSPQTGFPTVEQPKPPTVRLP